MFSTWKGIYITFNEPCLYAECTISHLYHDVHLVLLISHSACMISIVPANSYATVMCSMFISPVLKICSVLEKHHVRKARMLCGAIREVIENTMHHLLAFVPGILSPDSIPPLHLLSQRAGAQTNCFPKSIFTLVIFLMKKKKLFPPVEIITQNYDALISRPLKSN